MIVSALPQLVGSESKPTFRRIAVAASAAFVLMTAAAAIYGRVPGPKIVAFLPICATLWSIAELLTAFLLFSQFYVAGKISLAFMATAYALTGLLTVPYLFAFPGVFGAAPLSTGELQVSVWIWVLWHCSFPLIIGITHLVDPTLDRRTISRAKIGRALPRILIGLVAFSVFVSGVIWTLRDHIMILVMPGGVFTHDYAAYVAPVVVVINLAALVLVSRSLLRPTPLQMWVAFALLASVLDGVLNATAPSRYSIAWYVGKLESLTAASSVLVMLLVEISTLYRRLSDVATIDPLTGLQNRRTLDADIDAIVVRERREHHGIAMLVLDLDNFKHFNDTYGHALGDDVLRIVAEVLRRNVFRPGDVIARYGGEEFVMVLPDTSLEGARVVGERVRMSIAATRIPTINGETVSVTSSIGIAYLAHTSGDLPNQLFSKADRALYVAKAAGRNRIVVSGDEPALPSSDLAAIA